jgi:hypothetical protein
VAPYFPKFYLLIAVILVSLYSGLHFLVSWILWTLFDILLPHSGFRQKSQGDHRAHLICSLLSRPALDCLFSNVQNGSFMYFALFSSC